MIEAVRNTLASAVMLMTSASLADAQASWLGNTVTATLTAHQGLTVSSAFGSPTSVMLVGSEFAGQVTDASGHVFGVALDIEDTQIIVSFAGNADATVSGGPLLEITLGGLDGTHKVLAIPGTPPSYTLIDNLPASLVLGFATIRAGDVYTFAVPTPNAVVPEPASFLLLAAGLLGLGAARRQRETA